MMIKSELKTRLLFLVIMCALFNLAMSCRADHGMGGVAAESLVGIEVTNYSTDRAVKSVRHGNGCIIRPDGFIVAPKSIFSRAMRVADAIETAATQSISVFVNPGTDHETKFAAKSPRYETEGVGYVVIRIVGWQGSALKLYECSDLTSATELSIKQATWNPKLNRWNAAVTIPNKLLLLPVSNRDGRRAVHQLMESLTDSTLGSLVTMTDRCGVGMICHLENSIADAFEDFGKLGDVSNSVAVQPHIPSLDSPLPTNVSSPPMIKVPASTLVIPKSILLAQPDMEGETKASLGDFEVDRLKVTNREYLDFWRSLAENDRKQISFQSRFYPATWSKSGQPFSNRIADFPVLSVPLSGAREYARRQGKRLLTPYEWVMAMLGPGKDKQMPEWTSEYVRDHKFAWDAISEAHRAYVATSNGAVRSSLIRDGSQIPWVGDNPILREAYIWSRTTTKSITDQLYEKWLKPSVIREVGTREYDVSPFGMADALLNGPEIVQPNPGLPVRGRMRVLGLTEYGPAYSASDQFRIITSKIIIGDGSGTPIPSLSRLYRRTILSPTTRELFAWSDVNDVAQLMAPLAGIGISYSPIETITGVGMPSLGKGGIALFTGIDLWAQLPSHFELEVGTAVPLNYHETHFSIGPSLYYHCIFGFRCAK